MEPRAPHDQIQRLAFGARPSKEGVLFRVWAPLAKQLSVSIISPRPAVLPMERDADETFTAFVRDLEPGAEYFYEFERGRRRPDPVSRCQPRGVHEASEVIDPSAFNWTDGDWHGRPLEDLIIYEVHTGTFSSEGTFAGIIGRIPYLCELGITAVEIMPVASFAGARNWGYDGVSLYAPHTCYGGAVGLKRMVDACHRAGLAVVLDVVYNHLGPEGNYLAEYGPYFTDRYRSPWGQAINFDGPGSDAVRRFFIDNALYWLTEYHVDALRLDAIHEIFDFGAIHILHEMADAFHRQARLLGRDAWLIAESDLNDPRVINVPAIGGHGLDAQWHDDFHHALHTILTNDRSGYFADFGRVADLGKAISEGFVYDGRRSEYRGRHHGAPSVANSGRQFVVFNQNHDQIANADAGRRLSQLVSPAQQRLAATILFCAPALPMLFMGEEFGASTPFNYFTSFTDPALATAVSEGRRREYGPFFSTRAFPDPQAPETFAGSRIDWAERDRTPHGEMLAFSRALIELRTSHPCLANCRKDLTQVSFGEEPRWLIVRRGDPSGLNAVLLCNLGEKSLTLAVSGQTRDLVLALYTGDEAFGPAPAIPPPPETIDRPGAAVELAGFSAALYLANSGKGAA